jgi:hypothetical protein
VTHAARMFIMMNYVKETGSRDLPLDQGLTSGIRFSSMSPVIGEAARFQTMRSDLSAA